MIPLFVKVGNAVKELAADAAGRLIKTDMPIVKQDDSIANLAASTIFNGTVIDLGAARPTCQVIVRKIGVASAGEALQIMCSDDGVTDWFVAAGANVSGGLAYSATSSGQTAVVGRPHARYVRARLDNGATVQSPTAKLVTTVHWGV